MWWLSFVDPARPKGERALGCALVLADDVVSAVKVAHALGINPGGEVAAMQVDQGRVDMLSFDLPVERLLSPAEATELAGRIAQDLGS